MSLDTLTQSKIELVDDGATYFLDGQVYDRVTDIISKVLPPYLVPWAENTGQEAMFKLLRENPSGEWTLENARGAIQGAGWDCESQKKEGGRRGAETHFAVEAWIKQGIPPTLEDFEPEHRPYARTLCQFLVEYEPVSTHSEITVHHPDLGYAGTIDALGKATKRPKGVRHKDITGLNLAWDFKTNKEKKVYDQHYFQLAAYRCGLDYHGVAVDGEAVVAIGPTPWKNSGKPYRVAPNYFPASVWPAANAFYRALTQAKAANPNRRKKCT